MCYYSYICVYCIQFVNQFVPLLNPDHTLSLPPPPSLSLSPPPSHYLYVISHTSTPSHYLSPLPLTLSLPPLIFSLSVPLTHSNTPYARPLSFFLFPPSHTHTFSLYPHPPSISPPPSCYLSSFSLLHIPQLSLNHC